ncbi:argininosuccinate lyase [Ramlibacter albus]|uniref:Argininosuccinate lyase n=1 Tax=Ramlibacter albus TaxID=2079448 RepID=A0A923S4F1_9BURK|nr:argininosuccinate lyase [Ramlibacter albus]MBC5766853.1 argininosuccinate lyase [Ramlibacter albus]
MESKVSRRLSEGTAPEVCEHVYAPRLARDFPAVFAHLCDVNQAHLLMLRRAGLLPAADGAVLAAALLRIEEEGFANVPLDPAIEDAYFNYEAHLMRVAGAHVGGCLHVARSRNDILSTMDRMRARLQVLDLLDAGREACAAALANAQRYADVVMPGYTHLQPAQPITYGYWLLGVAESLARDLERFQQAQAVLARCPLGAGALAGTSFGILPQESARLLGFESCVPNALDAVASRDYALALMSSFAIAAVGASRVAQDFYTWCTHEFGLVDFPDSVAGTSSIMPQKKNPIVLESLKGKAGQLTGLLAGALTTVKGVNFTHTGDGNRETMRGFFEAADETLRIFKLLALVLRTATPNEAAMLERARNDFCTATDLADALVRESGLSFREAHHVVGAVVRTAMDAKLAAHEITSAMVDEACVQQIGRAVGLGDETVRRSLDPALTTAERRQGGAPAPDLVRARVQELQQHLARVQDDVQTQRSGLAAARETLKSEVRALAAAAR